MPNFVVSMTIKAIDQASAAIGAVKGKLSETSGFVQQHAQSFQMAGAAIAGTGLAITAGLGAMVKSASDYGEEMMHASKMTGVGTEALAGLRLMADESGSSVQTLQNGLRYMTREVGLGKDVYAEYGIATRDAAGNMRDSEDIFRDIATTVAGMESPAERAGAAAELLGTRYGPDLLRMLEQGGEGIDAYMDKAKMMGLAIDEESLQRWDDFGDSVAAIGGQLKGLGMTIANALMPALEPLVAMASTMVARIQEWSDKHPILTGVLVTLTGAVAALMVPLGALLMALPRIASTYDAWVRLAPQVTAFLAKHGGLTNVLAAAKLKLAVAARAAWAAVTGPIGLVIAAIAAVAVGVYLVIKHWDAIKEFFSKLWSWLVDLFKNNWKIILAVICPPAGVAMLLAPYWEPITDWFAGLWDKVKAVFTGFWEWAKDLFLSYAPAGLVITHWDGIVDWFGGLWGRVKGRIAAAWEAIKELYLSYTPAGLIIKHWEGLVDWFRGLWDRVKETIRGWIAWVGEAGSRLWNSFVEGMKRTAMRPIEAVKEVMARIRKYLPFSDAQEGPLADLTRSGQALAQTFARGMLAGKGAVQDAAATLAGAAADTGDEQFGRGFRWRSGADAQAAGVQGIAGAGVPTPPGNPHIPGDRGGPQTVTVNVAGSIYGEEPLRKIIRQELTDALRQAARA
ncbi:MAG: phage tail tape measure protein [Candidatus Thermoplasmatota archaeon]|nr:phage tail tape measure protein [Candidatus Thermoplasmatota archaeon]